MKVYYKNNYLILLAYILIGLLLIGCTSLRIRPISDHNEAESLLNEDAGTTGMKKGFYGIGIGLDFKDLSFIRHADFKLEVYTSSTTGDNALSTIVIDFKQASGGLGLAEAIKISLSRQEDRMK